MTDRRRELAFVFAGQGSEYHGMCLDVLDAHDAARALIHRASEYSGVDVYDAIRRGTPSLARTEVLQPTLTAVALGVSQTLAEGGISASRVAGHSLGEVAAAAAAGFMTNETAIELAAHRGRLMADAALAIRGGMAAVSHRTYERIVNTYVRDPTGQSVELAARNAPDEYVITGAVHELDALAARFELRRLPVSGAWHSSQMSPAVEPFARALRAALHSPRGDTRVIFHRARDGAAVTDTQSACATLAHALTSSIDWPAVLDAWTLAGITDVVTVGPGRFLRGLIRKCLGERMTVHAAESLHDIRALRLRVAHGGP